MHIDLNDPWLQERSRAMHVELDTTPERDTQTAIMRRHVEATLSERGVAADDPTGFNDMLKDLFHAACPEQIPDARMLVGMGLMVKTKPAQPSYEPDPACREMTPEETRAFFRRALAAKVAP